jgi:hypothetical protein
MNALSNVSITQLQRAIAIKEQIEALENELGGVLGAPSEAPTAGVAKIGRKKFFSAATRRKMAAAQKARWAVKNGEAAESPAPIKKKRKMSAAGRAAIAAGARARWAKYWKAKK